MGFMDYIILFLTGIFVSGVATYTFLNRRKKTQEQPKKVEVHSIVEKMEKLGVLNVYKVKTKEIVTASDHLFGDVGKKYLSWFISRKKVAIIFSFDIDFTYDLMQMSVEEIDNGRFQIKMPECAYTLNIKEINFYDEQNGKLLPWLLPEMISGVFSSGFNEDDRNNLIQEAKKQVSAMAQTMLIELLPDVQLAAKSALEQITRNLNIDDLTIDFSNAASIENNINYLPKSSSEEEIS